MKCSKVSLHSSSCVYEERQTSRASFGLLVGVFLIMVATGLAAFASPAHAVTDSEELVRFGSNGSGAGQLSYPDALAVDATTGHVYVDGLYNNRIEEFTAWGEFVKAFGWDVASGAVSEEQEVRVRAAAGQFKLTFGVSTTADLPLGASAAQMEAALDGLPTIGEAGGSVSVREVAGNSDGSIPYVYVVTFNGSLGAKDVPQLDASNGTVPLSGGTPSTSLEVRTRADGTPGGSGLESCTVASGCQKGTAGSGAGQLQIGSIAADSSGDIYVSDFESHRIQKFSASGRFLLMFGGQVDKTKVAEREEQEAKAEPVTVTAQEEDVCTDVSGDQCGAGIEGANHGQLDGSLSLIALGIGSTVFVSGRERIEEFEADGHYKSEISFPGKTVNKFVIDPNNGDFYVVFGLGSIQGKIVKLSPSGTSIGELEVGVPNSLATDSDGDLYAVDTEHYPEHVVEFDATGKVVADELALGEPAPGSAVPFFGLRALTTNTAGDLYIANVAPGDTTSAQSFIRALGPAPVRFESPSKLPPAIGVEYAGSVDASDATLHAQINPKFWNDTTFYVEYGSEACDVSACVRQPLASSSLLTDKITDLPVTSAGVLLGGLRPASTYHYRFVAQSGGGGPVFGADQTFRTYAEPAGVEAKCSNDALRTGSSALLPDCRAYEMVSPVDKNNGDVVDLLNGPSYQTAVDQSARSGESLTYTSYRAFSGAPSAPYAVQYLAKRDARAGWSNEAISPAQGVGSTVGTESTAAFDNEYKFFTAELDSGWLELETRPPLAPGGIDDSPELYRRDNDSGGYQTVTAVEPAYVKPTLNRLGSEVELQDVSADGVHAVFRIDAQLTPGASSRPYATYEWDGSVLHPVCILPNGTPTTESCSAGTTITVAGDPYANHLNNVAHTISSDGSHVYWTTSQDPSLGEGPGALYLRENAEQEQSPVAGGKCTEPAMACTVAVSQTGIKVHYQDASSDGSKALYTVEDGDSSLNGNLYLFDAGSEGSPRRLLAKQTVGVVGASEDLSYIYFVSREAIAGTDGAKAKEPNLYLYHSGSFSFIARLAESDVIPGVIYESSDTSMVPTSEAARVTPDGHRVVFISTAALTGYDNTDQLSGEQDFEVFTYEAGSSGPVCVSCNPSGSRPVGRDAVEESGQWFAASIPPWENQLQAARTMSDDGSRVFFDSYDSLTPHDTNGVEDVYEWEASGAGDCALDSPSYSVLNAGCVSLISSGESAQDSQFRDASASGDDVFFTTGASLVAQDPGLVDIYDARVDGGFTAPSVPASCEGEACQNPPTPPIEDTPASLTFSGAGNPAVALSSPRIGAKAKTLTRAQKLANALKGCRLKAKHKRRTCETQARRRYGKAKSAKRARKGVN